MVAGKTPPKGGAFSSADMARLLEVTADEMMIL
jgi:hypothetical protein